MSPALLKNLPLVSVIIPTYNYGHFIGQTLESVLCQTYQNWECVVVDDASTDDTSGVVNRYAAADARIKYLRQKNQLQAVAKNTGIEHSTGKYLQFLDADDLLEARKIERHVKYLEQHSEVDIVYGSMRYFNSDTPSERLYSMAAQDRPWMPEVSGRGREIFRRLVYKNIMAINSPLLRREVARNVGLFDPELPPVEDWDFLARCAAAGKCFQFLDAEDTLALVRIHLASSSQKASRMLMSSLRFREKIARMTDDKEILQLNRQMTAPLQAAFGAEEVACGRRSRGIDRFLTATAMSKRRADRVRWIVCALIAPFASAQQLRALLAYSPKKYHLKELMKTKFAGNPPH